MTQQKLRVHADHILRSKCVAVEPMNSSVQDLMDGMGEICTGIMESGWQPPQVGMLKRVIIADFNHEFITLANSQPAAICVYERTNLVNIS